MKFFKPEDFFKVGSSYDELAKAANSKLENEGDILTGVLRGDGTIDISSIEEPTHTGILICVEPIEKCTHSKEKIISMEIPSHENYPHGVIWTCDCGAKVKPKVFEEIT